MKKEFLSTAGGNANYYNHYGKQYGDFFKKLNTGLPYGPAIPRWAYAKKLWTFSIIETPTPPYLSQQPRNGLNYGAHTK